MTPVIEKPYYVQGKKFICKQIVKQINGVSINSVVLKVLKYTRSFAKYVLDERDCKLLHVKYEPGLILYPLPYIPKEDVYEPVTYTPLEVGEMVRIKSSSLLESEGIKVYNPEVDSEFLIHLLHLDNFANWEREDYKILEKVNLYGHTLYRIDDSDYLFTEEMFVRNIK